MNNLDEIVLREVFQILWKKRKFISVGVLLFVVIASVFALSIPNVYRIKILISPGVISRSPEDGVRFTKSLANYKGEIDAGVYTNSLEKHLASKFKHTTFSSKNLSTSIPENSSALLITYDTNSPEYGEEVLNHLRFLIKTEDDSIYDIYVKDLEYQIELDVNALSGLGGQIDEYNRHLLGIEIERKAILQQIERATRNSAQNSVEGLKSMISSEEPKDRLYKTLLYSNVVIQQRQLLVDLNNKLNELNVQIGQFESQKQSVSEMYFNLLKTVGKNRGVLNSTTAFREIIPVMKEGGLVGPNRKLLIMMSFVGSMFFMVLAVFIGEHFKAIGSCSGRNLT